MKILKKAFAIVCALSMLASFSVASVSAGQVATNYVTISMVDNTSTSNSIDINFNTSLATIKSATIAVRIPDALRSYISSCSWSTDLDGSFVPNTTITQGKETTEYFLSAAWSASTAQTTNGALGTLTINLVAGGIPSGVSAADRTIVIAGYYKAATKKMAVLVSDGASVSNVYAYDATVDSSKAPTNYWSVDPTAAGNYVVVPTAAAPTPSVTWVDATQVGGLYAADSYVEDQSKAVAWVVSLPDPEEAQDAMTWKADFGGTTKGMVKNFAGSITGATKFGVIIKGVTASDDVTEVKAAWGDQTPSAE